MAAARRRMEPFIQLSYGEQCSRKSSKLTETSFIDKKKVSELFWIDLLETKCQEGLGEVSEGLLNDESLTPEDFLDDPQVSPKISALQENNYHTSTEPADCNEFKTPLTSRYGHKNAETPCLFSQDDSVNATPISSQRCDVHVHMTTQSQPTCIGGTQSDHGSPAASQVLCTPAALSRYKSFGVDWSKRKAKTPDLLAEIMGPRRSSLSGLLAGSDDDEVAEWSESMATPPLKITKAAAADETDGEEETGEKTAEEEYQPSSRRIARVLFSGSTTNKSLEPLELSLDDAATNQQPLDHFDTKDSDGDTVETTDGSRIQEEFLLEYSCYSESKCQGEDRAENLLEGTLVASPSLNNSGLSKTEYDDRVISTPLVSTGRPNDLESFLNLNSLHSHSPFPDNFLSPSNRTPLKVLAQSTPKPNISRSNGFDAIQNNRSVTEELDTSLPCDTHALIDSSNPLCEKSLVQELCDVSCHTSEVNSKHNTSDVTFGSPSRSFELAMAREADKLSSGKEKGSSISPSSPSPPTDDVLDGATGSQSTEISHHTSEIAIMETNVTESTARTQVNEVCETTAGIPLNQATKATTRIAINQANRTKTNTRGPQNQACEISPGSGSGCGSLTRKKSFCKVPGLRRSTRTKRFLYPTASQVSKEDTAKRCRDNSTFINDSGVLENENATATDEKGVVICGKNLGDEAVCNVSCGEGGQGEAPVTKKLKINEKEKGCDSGRDSAQMSSQINGAEKDDVIFDMDTLSQFPIDCVMSPPSLNSDSDSLNVDTSLLMARRELNVTYTITTNKTQSIEKIIDPMTNCRVDGVGSCNNEVCSIEKSMDDIVEENGRPVFEEPVSSSVLETNAPLLCFESNNSGFRTVRGKRYELSGKGLNCTGDLFEELNLPIENSSARSISQECDLSTVGMNGVCRELEVTNANRKMVDLQALHSRISSTLSTATESEDNHSFRLSNPKPDKTFERSCSDLSGESSAVKPGKIDGVTSGLVGFHTASGKRVSVSSEALAKAKATMEEVDSSLGLHERPSGDQAASAKGSSTLKRVGTSCKLTPNLNRVPSSSKGVKPDMKLTYDHVVSKRENIPEFEERQVPAFCGFSTASGKQVRVLEASLKQARGILKEVDAELNADCGELPSKVTTEECPTYRIRNKPSASEKEVGAFPDFQEVPRVSTGNDAVSSLPGCLGEVKYRGSEAGDLDLCEMDSKQFGFQSRPDYSNTNLCKANVFNCVQTNCVGASVMEDCTLQNTGDIETKRGENVNDSLLEDLLNDCKKKRKYSMETISEERESLLEKPRAEEYSDVKNLSSVSDNREAMEERDNIPTESRLDVISRNHITLTSVSVSEPPLIKGENTWNKIDEDLTFTGSGSADRESINGFDTLPMRAMEYLESSLIVDKRNADQTQGELLMEGITNELIANSVSSLEFRTASGKAVEISEDALLDAKSTMEKIDKEICSEAQNNSGSVGFDSTFNKDFKKPEGTRTVRDAVKEVDKDVSREECCKRVADVSTFSGFHTAGGRKVCLSKEALKAGRDIMKRLVEDASEDYLREKQEMSSLLSTMVGCHFTNPENISTSKRDRGKEAPRLVNSKKEEAKDRSGFHTARERREGAHSPTDNLYSEADKGSKSSGFCGFQTAFGQRVNLSKEALQKGAAIMQQIESERESKTVSSSPSLSGFSGFQTAAGKRVNLSKESLEKGAAIMQQIERSLEGNSEDTKSSTACKSGFSGFQTASEQRVESLEGRAVIKQKVDKSPEGDKKTSETNTTNASVFPGFQTAAGNRVNISKESFEKGATIMKQIDRSLEGAARLPSSGIAASFSGFQTAKGDSVKLSKESLERGEAMMQEIDRSLEEGKVNSSPCSEIGTGFSGFQTARGDSVKLSKESLERGAATMQEIDRSLEEGKGNSLPSSGIGARFPGFQTAKGESIKLSKESLERGAAIMQEIDRSLEEGKGSVMSNSSSTTGFLGFQTASGQSIKLSKESLEKGTAIMQQIDKSLEDSKGNSRSNSSSETGFSGFQTARGQRVKLSKESLQKGAAIMQQIDKSLKEVKGNSVCSSEGTSNFSVFQTGRDQSVKLPKEALEKGAEILQQMDKSLEVKTDKGESCITSFSTFSGFQTAGGKTVQVSQSALAKAKETMASIDKELSLLSSESEHLGFQNIAEGKTSKVTRETGGHAKFINEGTDNSSVLVKNDDDANFQGFFTAGGQRMLVSEEALSKARTFLSETDNDLSGSKIEQGTEASLRECSVPTVSIEVQGITAPTPERSRFVEHDEVVSREILESSEALLADEPFMDVAEYLHDKQGRFPAGRSSMDSPRPRGSVLERGNGKHQSGVASGSRLVSSLCHSTPIQCSDDMFWGNHTVTRNGMKPCTTTPSGVLHDRRTKSLHVPLRARQSSYENIQRSGSPRLYNDTDVKNSSRSSDFNRSLKPLKALTSGCFKSKTDSLPRTSTPVNSTINRRTFGPRPQFITPYRKQQTTRDVSPLARCSTASGLPVSGSPEGQVSGVKEPSPKKPRLSAPNGTLNTRSTHCGDASKAECKTKPQPGFLSQVRGCSRRIKLKELVGNTTPGGFSTAELTELGVSPELLSVTSSNARSFRFDGRKYFSEAVLSSKEGVRTEDGGMLHAGTDGSIGLEEIQRAFLSTPGVDKQLINEEWITNSYRWIIWKLAAMEVAFPHQFAGRCLSPDWVLCQLKYRYDREIDNSNRSALKKIMERDDISSRTMVLCVSNVSVSENETESAAQETNDHDGETDGRGNVKKAESSAVIELTDGWYAIRGLLDGPLTRLLNDKMLNVGQKLCIYGAELVGSEQAVSPLEAPSSLMLRLHANSTRRARWDAKLGFHSHTHAFPLPLASLFGDGGFTGCVDVIVLRQYPVQWMEKTADGTNVFRNSRLEEREAEKFEADRHQRREKLFLKIQEQFEKEFRQLEPERRRSARFRRRSLSSCDLSNLHDGKEIYEALNQASDPDAFKEFLTERQIRALEDYRRLLQERKCAELQSKFERVWKEQEEENQRQRNVVPLLKARVTDYSSKGQAKQNAVLSIWRPSEEVMQLLSEGSRLRIYHLTAAGVRFRQGSSELQLSATRTTRYEVLPSDPDVKSISYVRRQACSFDELRCGSSQQWTEVDIVGLVVLCSPLSSFSSSSSSLQTVYLSDEESNLVAIKFWGGLKAVAVEDLVKPRSFICCSNLTVRPDDRLQCPSLVFSDLSSLTLKPRELHLRTALNKLHQSIPDLNLFMARIQETLTSFLRPHRSSPPADIKVNTVRMYGKSAVTGPTGWMQQKHESSDATNTSESTDKENCSSISDERDRLPGFAQSSVCHHNRGEAQESFVPSVKEHSASAVASTSSCAVSRQAKRKLLDSIPEPPPLSPLPSSVPDTVRREFKRPRRVASSDNVRLEQ